MKVRSPLASDERRIKAAKRLIGDWSQIVEDALIVPLCVLGQVRKCRI
jgi:hypothetical protein